MLVKSELRRGVDIDFEPTNVSFAQSAFTHISFQFLLGFFNDFLNLDGELFGGLVEGYDTKLELLRGFAWNVILPKQSHFGSSAV